MAEKRQRINVNIYRASHNAEESQYVFDVEEELKKLAAEATGSTITMTIEPAADENRK